MKKSFIYALVLVTSISLVGCGSASRSNTGSSSGSSTGTGSGGSSGTASGGSGTESNAGSSTRNNITNKVVEGSRKTADNAMNAAENTGDAIKYTAQNLKQDFVNAGYQLKDSVNAGKGYFKGNETNYSLGNDMVRVYEYNSSGELENDVKRISPNGLSISGTSANYTSKPYYYRKGNSLIMYEGSNPSYVNRFNTMYGNTIIP